MIGDCVVDASVAIKLFVLEESSEKADTLFEQLVFDPPVRFYVPDLLFIELANILFWKYVRNYGYPAENARQDVADLQALALRSVSTADLLVPALELALAKDITTYDACYAALAHQLHLPLITADLALERKLQGTQINILILQDL
jgi:predicted nucleic acid-binding protein